MSLANTVTLGALRIQARQRADLESNNAVTDSEFNQYISQSWKRLFDMLVGAYGNDYYVAPLFQFTLSNTQYYPLPDGTINSIGSTSPAPACYKLLGVDLQYQSAPSGWVTLRRFEEIERNKYSLPNIATTFAGTTNLQYRISGTQIEFIPYPMAGQAVQLKYIPKPTPLQFLPSCATNAGSNLVTMADVGDLSVGMSAYSLDGNILQPNTTVTAINTTLNQVTLSLPAWSTNPIVTLSFWRDDSKIDGVSGWEEYIIIDAAIKAWSKLEYDVSELRVQKDEMVQQIAAMAEGRDAGQAHHVSDVLGANGSFGDGGYGDGWGGGSGWY